MACEVAHDLAATGRMADMDRVLHIEMRGHRRQVVGIMVEVVAITDLRRATMPTPVMRDHTIALCKEEQQLRVPVVGGKRPAMAEHDRLARTPILVKNL